MAHGSPRRTASLRFDGEVSPTVLLAVNLSKSDLAGTDPELRRAHDRLREDRTLRAVLVGMLREADH
jgi:hypothetical protein